MLKKVCSRLWKGLLRLANNRSHLCSCAVERLGVLPRQGNLFWPFSVTACLEGPLPANVAKLSGEVR